MNRARNTVVVLLCWVALILIFLAFVWLMNREHAGVNAGLPLVEKTDATLVCTPTVPPKVRRYRGVTYA